MTSSISLKPVELRVSVSDELVDFVITPTSADSLCASPMSPSPLVIDRETLLTEIFKQLENPYLDSDNPGERGLAQVALSATLLQLQNEYPEDADALFEQVKVKNFGKKRFREKAMLAVAAALDPESIKKIAQLSLCSVGFPGIKVPPVNKEREVRLLLQRTETALDEADEAFADASYADRMQTLQKIQDLASQILGQIPVDNEKLCEKFDELWGRYEVLNQNTLEKPNLPPLIIKDEDDGKI